jgi:hypothetical protein
LDHICRRKHPQIEALKPWVCAAVDVDLESLLGAGIYTRRLLRQIELPTLVEAGQEIHVV